MYRTEKQSSFQYMHVFLNHLRQNKVTNSQGKRSYQVPPNYKPFELLRSFCNFNRGKLISTGITEEL